MSEATVLLALLSWRGTLEVSSGLCSKRSRIASHQEEIQGSCSCLSHLLKMATQGKQLYRLLAEPSLGIWEPLSLPISEDARIKNQSKRLNETAIIQPNVLLIWQSSLTVRVLEVLLNALLSNLFLKEFLETWDLCSENFLKIWKTISWGLQFALTKEVFIFIFFHNKLKVLTFSKLLLNI